MRHYIGIVHKDPQSDYGISFPDFPGAVTAAATYEEAVEMAAEALALHVEGLLAEGETIPEPSNFEQVRENPDHRDGLPVLVPLKSDSLAQRLQVTLPAPIVRRIDAHIAEWGQSRSSFLAEAAKHELETKSTRGTRMSSRKRFRRAAKRPAFKRRRRR
jgi:predicted RNase H-like HicB family nuclease